MNSFQYLHTVSFEETNVVGNVYFSNYIKWQGLCREHFLFEKVPDLLLEDMDKGMALVTINCGCHYLSELRAFDQVRICMYLEEMVQNRLKLIFEYYNDKTDVMVAKGTHEVGFFMRHGTKVSSVAIPEYIVHELVEYEA